MVRAMFSVGCAGFSSQYPFKVIRKAEHLPGYKYFFGLAPSFVCAPVSFIVYNPPIVLDV